MPMALLMRPSLAIAGFGDAEVQRVVPVGAELKQTRGEQPVRH